MTDPASGPEWTPPTSLAELRLPPTFVRDHGIRTLSYQGAMTPSEIATQWRVHSSIVLEVMEALKAAGLVQLDGAQSNFERGRLRLTETGLARVAAARQRTWYSGPLPVSLSDAARRAERGLSGVCSREALRAALDALCIEHGIADELGQAIGGGATVWVTGADTDEQGEIAAALGRSLMGEVTLPYAIFAAGSILRVFDGRYHRAEDERIPLDGDLDVLRVRSEAEQWFTSRRPVVSLAGGVLAPDVLPAYDDDARFYVAPKPFAASGGLLAVLDSSTDLAALASLARLWLIPGRYATGIVLLRSGERLEVPWSAATVLFGEDPAVPEAVAAAVTYRVDVSALTGEPLQRYVAARLDPAVFSENAITAACALLEQSGCGTRRAAGLATRYLSNRAAYEGAAFTIKRSLLEQAIDAAERGSGAGRGAARAA
jgi:DNA-binding MarR family transcriptional regulator